MRNKIMHHKIQNGIENGWFSSFANEIFDVIKKKKKIVNILLQLHHNFQQLFSARSVLHFNFIFLYPWFHHNFCIVSINSNPLLYSTQTTTIQWTKTKFIVLKSLLRFLHTVSDWGWLRFQQVMISWWDIPLHFSWNQSSSCIVHKLALGTSRTTENTKRNWQLNLFEFALAKATTTTISKNQ